MPSLDMKRRSRLRWMYSCVGRHATPSAWPCNEGICADAIITSPPGRNHGRPSSIISSTSEAKGYNIEVSVQQKTERQDYYSLLNVAPNATPLDIRRAYRELARRLHPDVNPSADAHERFAAVARAYDTLSDPERRRAYDLSRSRPGA